VKRSEYMRELTEDSIGAFCVMVMMALLFALLFAGVRRHERIAECYRRGGQMFAGQCVR
jgi:hypothetical protein